MGLDDTMRLDVVLRLGGVVRLGIIRLSKVQGRRRRGNLSLRLLSYYRAANRSNKAQRFWGFFVTTDDVGFGGYVGS